MRNFTQTTICVRTQIYPGYMYFSNGGKWWRHSQLVYFKAQLIKLTKNSYELLCKIYRKCYLKTLFTYITDVDVFFDQVALMKELYTSVSCHSNGFLFSLSCNEDCLHLNTGISTSLGDVINAGSFPAKREELFRAIKEFTEFFQEYESKLFS